MSLFTSQHIILSDVVAIRRTCLVGSDIWLIQRPFGDDLRMGKFNIDTNILLPIEYSIVDGHNSTYEEFEVCSSNDKIYMLTTNKVDITQLLEFNTINYEWRTLSTINRSLPPSNFCIIGNKMYLNLYAVMMVMWVDTLEVIKTVEMPSSVIDRVILLEINGLIYIVHITELGVINIYQYDEVSYVFQKIMEKNEAGRVDIEQLSLSDTKVTFACSNNNKIYVALVVDEKILINCFDVGTRQCYTVMDSYYETDDEVVDMIAKDNKVYVISKRILDVVIQEIDMDPSLETIALVNMAEMVVDDQEAYQTYKKGGPENMCMNVIPYELRTQFKSIVNRKIHLSILPSMEELIGELCKLKMTNELVIIQLMDIQLKMELEQQQLFQSIDVSLFLIQELVKEMGNVMVNMGSLQSKFLLQLDSQRNGQEEQKKLISDSDIRKYEELLNQFTGMIEQPHTPIMYIIPMGTTESVMVQQRRHMEDIDEIEEARKEQHELYNGAQQQLSQLIPLYK